MDWKDWLDLLWIVPIVSLIFSYQLQETVSNWTIRAIEVMHPVVLLVWMTSIITVPHIIKLFINWRNKK